MFWRVRIQHLFINRRSSWWIIIYHLVVNNYFIIICYLLRINMNSVFINNSCIFILLFHIFYLHIYSSNNPLKININNKISFFSYIFIFILAVICSVIKRITFRRLLPVLCVSLSVSRQCFPGWKRIKYYLQNYLYKYSFNISFNN